MTTLAKRPVLLLPTSERGNAAVMACGSALARSRGLQTRLLRPGTSSALEQALVSGALAAVPSGGGAPDPGVSLVVSDLAPASPAFAALLRATQEWRVPAVFVRGDEAGLNCRRLLVATGGGHHTLHQVGLARDLSRALGVPAQWLRVVRDDGIGARGGNQAAAAAAAELQGRILGLREPVCVTHGHDPVAGILSHVRPDDMVLVGTPNAWRAAAHFGDTVPDVLLRRLSNPLAMVSAPSPQALTVRDVLWESLVVPDLRVRDGQAAIAALIDTLVSQYQIPRSWRDPALERALRREAVESTAVGCETAFPHAAIPGFRGVLCCLGICPDGVAFRAGESEPVRFVFLMVTPADDYDDYLTVLGLLARRVVLPIVRAALSASRTGREALAVLAPAAVGTAVAMSAMPEPQAVPAQGGYAR